MKHWDYYHYYYDTFLYKHQQFLSFLSVTVTTSVPCQGRVPLCCVCFPSQNHDVKKILIRKHVQASERATLAKVETHSFCFTADSTCSQLRQHRHSPLFCIQEIFLFIAIVLVVFHISHLPCLLFILHSAARCGEIHFLLN